jgi:Cytochrome c554 and c-prime
MIFIRFQAVFAIVVAAAGLLSVHSAKAEPQTDAPATFVGAQACAGCHAPEADRWKNSHHALAMQKATAATVLGDFTNATLTHHGVTTTFSRAGEKFMVRTEGPDGALHDYQIAYTFGVYPLQQYLTGRPLSSARDRLGQPSEGSGGSAMVSPLPRPNPAHRR